MIPADFTQRLRAAIVEMSEARLDWLADESGSDAAFSEATIKLQDAAQLAWRILSQQEANK